MRIKVLLLPEPTGGYSASVPTMPGCHSQGETYDEAMANIKEAADLWLEVVAERAAREAQATVPNAELQEIEL